MMTGRFRVGDKVTSRIAKPDFPAGTSGTAVHVYRSLQNRYTVQFDTASVFMWGYDLAPAASAPARILPKPPKPPKQPH